MTEAFVYCWSDMLTNMLYIGFHKGSVDDGYVCSSKYMMEEYDKRPQDFKRSIVAKGSSEEMIRFEETLLKSIDAKNDPKLYNMHNGNGKFILKRHSEKFKKEQSERMRLRRKENPTPYIMTEERKKKLSDLKKGVPRSKESREKQSKTMRGENNHFYGKTHSEEFNKRQSENKKITQKGSGNTNAKSVMYCGKKYSTMKEMSAETNISLYRIRNMIKSGLVRLCNER